MTTTQERKDEGFAWTNGVWRLTVLAPGWNGEEHRFGLAGIHHIMERLILCEMARERKAIWLLAFDRSLRGLELEGMKWNVILAGWADMCEYYGLEAWDLVAAIKHNQSNLRPLLAVKNITR